MAKEIKLFAHLQIFLNDNRDEKWNKIKKEMENYLFYTNIHFL